MIPTKVLALGKYNPKDLEVSLSTSNRKIDPDIESKIEEAWNKVVKEAQEKGKVCYNGLSYRLNYLKESGKKIILDFATVEFKTRNGVKKIPGYFDLPEEFFVKGCFADGTVKTSDGYYLMIELSGKSMNENDTDLLGGIMETNFGMKTGQDIFDSLYAELEEEGGIHRKEIKKSYLRSVFLTYRTNVAFYFEVTLNIPLIELLERGIKDQDVKSLKGFSREEYLKVLKNHKSPSKHFVAEILDI